MKSDKRESKLFLRFINSPELQEMFKKEYTKLAAEEDGQTTVRSFGAAKHIGIHANRLKREPTEKALTDAWKLRATDTLNHILNGEGLFLSEHFSQRDATVAATVIQWIGSEVGAGFIDEVRMSKAYQKRRNP